jgi:electron transfer flavoprotein alpha subunit
MISSNLILLIAEQENGELTDISFELFGAGRNIADELNGELCAVILGNDIGHLIQTFAEFGIDRVYCIENPLLTHYSAELYTDALSDFLRDLAPRIILCGSTSKSSDLAPRIAARLKIGFVADCVNIRTEQNGLLLTKPTYGNQVHTTLAFTTDYGIATIESGMFKADKIDPPNQLECKSIDIEINPDNQRVKTQGTIPADHSKMDLSEADVIVAGGKGVGSAENFRLLEQFAESMSGCVAGTRMAVDAGWIESDRLVGLTGNTVKPKLYVACGISGALHHTLGMKDAKTVVAINTDANAPIFKLADIGIVGDILDVIPSIMDQLHISGDSV